MRSDGVESGLKELRRASVLVRGNLEMFLMREVILDNLRVGVCGRWI